MKLKPYLLAAIILLLSGSALAYTIDGDDVYIDNTIGSIRVSPHTLSSSGWVDFNLTSKTFDGNMNFVWGFDTTKLYPTKAIYWNPRIIEWTDNHTLDFINVTNDWSSTDSCENGIDNGNYKRLVEHQVEDLDGTTYHRNNTVCFDTYEQSGNDYIVYFEENYSRQENWTDISHLFGSISYEFAGQNKWWYLNNININQGQNYYIKIFMDALVAPSSNYKYDFAFYPSTYGSDIIGANNDNKLVHIDPWYNSNWGHRKNITFTTSGTLTEYQVNITIDTSTLISANKMQSDCDDIRFVNSTNHSLNYWLEPTTCNTASTIAWVKVPKVVDNEVIYMYYNNSGATGVSSSSNTFIDEIDNLDFFVPFDEGTGSTFTEHSGRQLDGSLIGSSFWYDGKWTDTNSVVINYSATTSHWSVDDNSEHLAYAGDMSVVGWVHPWQRVYHDGSGAISMIGRHNSGTAGGWYFFMRASSDGGNSGEFGWGHYYSGGWNWGWCDDGANCGISDDTWVHMGFTFDASAANGKFYTDADEETTTSESYLTATTNPANIDIRGGQKYTDYVGNDDYADAYHQDWAVFGDILTGTEITNIYNNRGYATENSVLTLYVRKEGGGNHPTYAFASEEQSTTTSTTTTTTSTTSTSTTTTTTTSTTTTTLPLGSACTLHSECEFFCVENVCCNELCDGTCESCLALYTPSSDGTCDNIDGTTDPYNECTPSSDCNEGNCDGAGACEILETGEGDCPVCSQCSDSDIACDLIPDNQQDTVGTTCSSTCKTCDGSGNCVNQDLGEDLFSQCTGFDCDGDAGTPYYFGWSSLQCYWRTDVNDATATCSASATCQTSADLCPSQPQNGGTGTICECSSAEVGCTGTTIGSCSDTLCSYILLEYDKPADAYSMTSNDTTYFNMTASNYYDLDNSTLRFYDGTGSLSASYINETTTGAIGFGLIGLAKGDYNWSITSCDLNLCNVTGNRTLVVNNTPPHPENVSIDPSPANDTDDLDCIYDYTDYDTDSEDSGSLEIRWYVNGALKSAFNDAVTLTSDETVGGDSIVCSIKVGDGEHLSSVVNSSILVLGDASPPTNSSTLSLTKTSAYSDETITGRIELTDEASNIDEVYFEIELNSYTNYTATCSAATTTNCTYAITGYTEPITLRKIHISDSSNNWDSITINQQLTFTERPKPVSSGGGTGTGTGGDLKDVAEKTGMEIYDLGFLNRNPYLTPNPNNEPAKIYLILENLHTIENVKLTVSTTKTSNVYLFNNSYDEGVNQFELFDHPFDVNEYPLEVMIEFNDKYWDETYRKKWEFKLVNEGKGVITQKQIFMALIAISVLQMGSPMIKKRR